MTEWKSSFEEWYQSQSFYRMVADQDTGNFIVPSAKTIRELLEEYVSIYGVNTWAFSTYEGHRG